MFKVVPHRPVNVVLLYIYIYTVPFSYLEVSQYGKKIIWSRMDLKKKKYGSLVSWF